MEDNIIAKNIIWKQNIKLLVNGENIYIYKLTP